MKTPIRESRLRPARSEGMASLLNKLQAVNGNVLKTPSSRVSRLRPPTSASQRSAGMVTPSRRLSTPSTLNTPVMADLMEELNRYVDCVNTNHSKRFFCSSKMSFFTPFVIHSKLDRGQEELLKAFESQIDKLADTSTKGFKDVNRTLALQHSSQLTHYRNSDRKMDRMLSEMEQLTGIKQMLQHLYARERPNVPSSITASTGTPSAMEVRSILLSNHDVAPSSTGNSTLSRVGPDVLSGFKGPSSLPSMTTRSQDIDTMKLEQQLEKSKEVIAVLEQQNRSKDVKIEQQDKHMRSMRAPPGHRDVMDIKPTPTQHSERTNKSIDKAVVTTRRGNRNRDIAPTPTRRSARNRPSVKKDP
jgi:hypothetical protein